MLRKPATTSDTYASNDLPSICAMEAGSWTKSFMTGSNMWGLEKSETFSMEQSSAIRADGKGWLITCESRKHKTRRLYLHITVSNK